MIWPFKSRDADLVDRDADALIARFADGAYHEARARAAADETGARNSLIVDGNRPPGHWSRVRRAIAKKTGHDGLDSATRRLESEPSQPPRQGDTAD